MTSSNEPLEMVVWMDGAVVARAGNIQIALAAYREVVKLYPVADIMLRHRARIIVRHKPGQEP